jgi:hypothetical protein
MTVNVMYARPMYLALQISQHPAAAHAIKLPLHQELDISGKILMHNFLFEKVLIRAYPGAEGQY